MHTVGRLVSRKLRTFLNRLFLSDGLSHALQSRAAPYLSLKVVKALYFSQQVLLLHSGSDLHCSPEITAET